MCDSMLTIGGRA
jgi:hypothetical protein